METTALRALIETTRQTHYPQAKPWPNGLGFDTGGWSFTYDERRSLWVVTKTRRGRLARGEGKTPLEAALKVRIV